MKNKEIYGNDVNELELASHGFMQHESRFKY